MSLEFRPVTQENWNALIKLRVRQDQKNFVASNLYSIAEAQLGFEEEGHWHLSAFGLYADDEPVGFAMTGLNHGHSRFQGFIVRLMVDESFQGKGYGRSATVSMIEWFRADNRMKAACITYESENEIARKLYASLGFQESGEFLENEVMAILRLR